MGAILLLGAVLLAFGDFFTFQVRMYDLNGARQSLISPSGLAVLSSDYLSMKPQRRRAHRFSDQRSKSEKRINIYLSASKRK